MGGVAELSLIVTLRMMSGIVVSCMKSGVVVFWYSGVDSDSPYDEWHCPTKLDPFHLRSHSIYYMEDAHFSCQPKHGVTRNQVYLYSKQS